MRYLGKLRLSRGDDPGEMGSQLPAVDLGTDFEAVQLVLGDLHSCALSSQGAVKCWGRSSRLGLGLGGGVYIGISPNEMGDALPAVDLGPLPAVQIAAGTRHTCVAACPHPVHGLVVSPVSHRVTLPVAGAVRRLGKVLGCESQGSTWIWQP